MKMYTKKSPPTNRNRKANQIWQALEKVGLKPEELHHNPNCWGKRKEDGWGTWACQINGRECWCGIDKEKGVYIEVAHAPYRRVYLRAGMQLMGVITD